MTGVNATACAGPIIDRMGLRFQKRIRLFPGVRLNVSKSGVSTSIGRRGAWLTFGRRGTRATVGLPRSGVYYTQTQSRAPSRRASVVAWIALAAIVVVVAMVIGALK